MFATLNTVYIYIISKGSQVPRSNYSCQRVKTSFLRPQYFLLLLLLLDTQSLQVDCHQCFQGVACEEITSNYKGTFRLIPGSVQGTLDRPGVCRGSDNLHMNAGESLVPEVWNFLLLGQQVPRTFFLC